MMIKDVDYRIVSPEEFDKHFDESHDELRGAKFCYVDDRSAEDYRDCTCIMFIDSEGVPEAYAAVDPDGVIGSVLKDKDSHKKEFLLNIMYTAFQYGGSKLDCYKDENSTLPYNYADAGFMPVCRIRFNREMAPEYWIDEAGTPDVVFMFFIDEGVDYDTYRSKVLNDTYPRFKEYNYIPYVEELFDRFPEFDHTDVYSFGVHIRDYMEDLWRKRRHDHEGKSPEFVREVIYPYRHS